MSGDKLPNEVERNGGQREEAVHEVEFDRRGGVSILPNEPKSGRHPFGGNILGSVAGENLGGESLALQNVANDGVKIGGGCLGLIDGEEKRASG